MYELYTPYVLCIVICIYQHHLSAMNIYQNKNRYYIMPRFAIYTIYTTYKYLLIYIYIEREKTNRMRFMFFSFPFSTFCTQNTHI